MYPLEPFGRFCVLWGELGAQTLRSRVYLVSFKVDFDDARVRYDNPDTWVTDRLTRLFS